MSDYSFRYGKKLRKGYTTGTAAAAASGAAVMSLMGIRDIRSIGVVLPSDDIISIPVLETACYNGYAMAKVRVDGGDDKNVLDKCIIMCRAEKAEHFSITAAEGIGMVTKPGLMVPVGMPAINPVPRKMIEQTVKTLVPEGKIHIELSVEDGEDLAKRTLNEKLGIVGGVSIIGTTGITEPMSSRGFIDSMYSEINMMMNTGGSIVVVSGNYGYSYASDVLGIKKEKILKAGNFIGDALFYLKGKDIKNILMIGHMGKYVKIAGGNFNTHSYVSDARMEIIASAVIKMTGNTEIALKVLESNTTDEAAYMMGKRYRTIVFDYLCDRALLKIKQIIKFSKVQVAFGMFDSKKILMGQSSNFREVAGIIND